MYNLLYRKIFWLVILINILTLIIFNLSYSHLQTYFGKRLNVKYHEDEYKMRSFHNDGGTNKLMGNTPTNLLEKEFSNELMKTLQNTTLRAVKESTSKNEKIKNDKPKRKENFKDDGKIKAKNNARRNVDEKIKCKNDEENSSNGVGKENGINSLKTKENIKDKNGKIIPDQMKQMDKNGCEIEGNISKKNKTSRRHVGSRRDRKDKSIPQDNKTNLNKNTDNLTKSTGKNTKNITKNNHAKKFSEYNKAMYTNVPKTEIKKNTYNASKNKSIPERKTKSYDDNDYYDEIIEENLKIKLNQPKQDYKNGIVQCPENPPNLIGKINVSTKTISQMNQLEKQYIWLKPGGSYNPPCIQKQNVAIIVPYRNRSDQLVIFLQYMHPFLKKQQIKYTIFVMEQENDSLPFNKGQIMNTGYVEASKIDNFTCFIFHDVDLLPEDDRILYKCTRTARHLIASIDKWNYTLVYADLFGGVVAIDKDVFSIVNGYSNRFWGWGGEDDDFRERIIAHKVNISRYSDFARYKMMKHQKQKENPNRYKLLTNNFKYFNIDGLNNLNSTVLQVDKYLLYTRVLTRLSHTK